ncbi:isochorismatase family protein [Brevibacillus sp. B_LB10_24]|uniref:isochorismatase family protein n=1 Tax=Brevibacillus sp. B_LB10_24 TaxID=3380645 RepID=UPI0038BCD001
MKFGLLIVDMQQIFLRDRIDNADVAEACEYINYVAGLLRAKDQRVIHIQDMEGSEGDADPQAREIIPRITVGHKDIRVTKQFSNAFWQTDLEQVLRQAGVEFVVVAGFAAEYCVTFTANGAVERGFKAAILQRGIVGEKPEAVFSTYRDRHLISYPVIKYMLDAMT